MNAAPVPSFCLKQGLDKQEVQLHSLVSCPCDSRSFFRSVPQPRHLPPRTHEKKNNSIFPEPCLLNCFSNLSEQHLATVKERRMEREREKKGKDVRRANKFEQTPSGVSRSLLAVVRRVMIVGNLGTQSPSVGPNPPISLRERGSRAEEKGGIVARDSAVKRGAYSTKLRSRQDNGCPSLAHSHTVSTQLYQTPLSFLPPLLCSVLSLSFLSRRPFFSSSQRDGG